MFPHIPSTHHLEMDSTSFKSILEGVKKLREGSNAEKPSCGASSSTSSGLPEPPAQPKNPETRSQELTHKKSTYKPQLTGPSQVISNKSTEPSGLALKHQQINKNKTLFSSIQVSKSQKGNPLLQELKTISWEFNGSLKKFDYLVNSTTFVMFLSLKYHKLRPEYLYNKMGKSQSSHGGQDVNLRILLVLVDIENSDDILREINKVCLLNHFSLVLAWSFEEAATYITYLKQLELSNTEKSIIRGQPANISYTQSLHDCLTTVRGVNKTDAVNLISKFGSFQQLVDSSSADQELGVQGMGDLKVERLRKAFTEPFIYNKEYVE